MATSPFSWAVFTVISVGDGRQSCAERCPNGSTARSLESRLALCRGRLAALRRACIARMVAGEGPTSAVVQALVRESQSGARQGGRGRRGRTTASPIGASLSKSVFGQGPAATALAASRT